eukprot:SAG31_NODE_2059_length_6539_cov_4.699845_8_plen_223_part_00
MDMLRARTALQDLKVLHENGLLDQAEYASAQSDIIQRATGAVPLVSADLPEGHSRALLEAVPPPPPLEEAVPEDEHGDYHEGPGDVGDGRAAQSAPPRAAQRTREASTPPPPPPPDTPPTSDDESADVGAGTMSATAEGQRRGDADSTQTAVDGGDDGDDAVGGPDDIGLDAIRSRLVRRVQAWFASVDIGGNKKQDAMQRKFDTQRALYFAVDIVDTLHFL